MKIGECTTTNSFAALQVLIFARVEIRMIPQHKRSHFGSRGQASVNSSGMTARGPAASVGEMRWRQPVLRVIAYTDGTSIA